MIPLSYAQRRLWFLHQVDPSPAYNIAFTLRLRGPIDTDAVRSALNDITDRHEVLRTILPSVDGEPVQQILDAGPVPLEVSTVAAADVDAAIAAAGRYVFDLATEIPLRAHLISLDPADHRLTLVAHHVAADGWSLAPLTDDLATAYAARVDGRAPGWEPLPIQYADYTLWQHDVLGDEADPDSVAAKQLRFWTAALGGMAEELRLPADRPRPAVPSHAGDLASVVVGGDLHARLLALSAAGNATLFMTLQAGLAALFHRLGAGDDVAFGTAVAGRVDEAMEDLVGFFVNTLVLRTDIAGNPTFRELIGRVREADLAAFAHQDLPFERIVEQLNPARSLSRHPLFQVMFVLQSQQAQTSAEASPAPGLAMEIVPVPAVSAKFDLTVAVSEIYQPDGKPDGLVISIEYATDLFDRATIERLSARLVRLLDTVTVTPDARVDDIDLLEAAERALVTREWQGATIDFPQRRCVPDLIADNASNRPDAPAVVAADGVLSYAALDARANQIAYRLRMMGVVPGTLVGVCLDRGVDMVASMLGILKAGAAYVPLDPHYPAARLEFLVADTAMPVVVTRAALASTVPPGPARLRVDDLAATPVTAAGAGPGPDTIAYVIHTSGSTGTPKGVIIRHRNLTDMCLDHIARYQITAADRTSQVAALGFDATVWEIWPYLCAGAAVHLPAQSTLDDADALLDWIVNERLTCCFLPTPRLELLIDHPRLADSGLRLLFTAGDVLRRTPPAGLPFRLVNLYGPTEYTVVASGTEIPPGPSATLPPIGTPVANTAALVLDARLSPAPIGVPGDLYLAGNGIAAGYLNKPGLSAARFIANPYGAPGDRMYRTGDIVRWLPSGDLSFIGRADNQVKIRGIRIELGEIEAAIAHQPGVDQVAVITVSDPAGASRLVAYVAGTGLDPDAMRRDVGAGLPDYLVPSIFITLPALPLTVNGKLDRAALPAPVWPGGGTGRAPRTRREQFLTEIFADTLQRATVSVDDNFFDLGGHSLLATRMISRIRRDTGTAISIRSLFAAPTPALLAAHLDAGDGDDTDPLAVMLPLRGSGTRPPLFCVHPAAGISWVYAELLRHLDADQPVYGLQARGFTDPAGPTRTIADIVIDYLAEIRRVQPAGPYHLMGWSFGGVVAHALAIALRDAGEAVSFVAILDGYPAHVNPDAYTLAGDDPVTIAELLRSLGLDGRGVDGRGSDGGVSVADYHRIAREPDSPLSALGDRGIDALPAVFAADGNAVNRHESGRYDGDVLFFAATAGTGDHRPDPDEWRSHVASIEIHDIDCRHGEMTQAGPIARIGPILADRLRSARTHASTPECTTRMEDR